MKNLQLILTPLLSLTLFISHANGSSTALASSKEQQIKRQKAIIQVEGMTCEMCAASITHEITNHFKHLDPKIKVKVEVSKGMVHVESSALDRLKIFAAIKKAGYKATSYQNN